MALANSTKGSVVQKPGITNNAYTDGSENREKIKAADAAAVDAAEARAASDYNALQTAIADRKAASAEKPATNNSAATGTTQAALDSAIAAETTPIQVATPTATQVLDTTAPSIQKSSYYDTTNLANTLNESLQAAQKQANASIDYGVETGVNELNRALEDAQQTYQTERDQVAYDERTAMDNQALYNQARGDNGGIGAAQYNSIQNTAAQNRLAINNQQTQLATDTARQIADLRAQGEFDKADKLLELTQEYLSKLMTIEQWGAEYNLSVDQINQAIDQWAANYEQDAKQYNANYALNEASLTGYYNGSPTYENATNLVSSLTEYGIAPDTETLMKLGFTQAQAEAIAGKITAQNTVSTGTGYSGTVEDYLKQRLSYYSSKTKSADSALQATMDDALEQYPWAGQAIADWGYDYTR